MQAPSLYLGSQRPLDGVSEPTRMQLPAHHLVTHGVIVGTTGSGKTGLVTVLIEEALRNEVPVLVIDVKGDLPNLLLAFPDFAAESFLPWVEGSALPSDTRPQRNLRVNLQTRARKGLACGDSANQFWPSTERAPPFA